MVEAVRSLGRLFPTGGYALAQPQRSDAERDSSVRRGGLIKAAGNSPLTQYVAMLVSVPEHLKRLLERDAEAIRTLTAPALSESLVRGERWFWDRQREKQTGEIICSPRIWTRRDQRRVNHRRALESGPYPTGRAARYLNWLQPRTGASLHDQWFRRALNEARKDGLGATLVPKLEQASGVYGRVLHVAQSLSQDEGVRSDFDEAHMELMPIACELMDWTKEPQSNENTTQMQHANSPSSVDGPKQKLIAVLTEGVADERINKAARVLANSHLSANDKLERIDSLTPLPPTSSSAELGAMLGITKQAIQKTDWWQNNRAGLQDDLVNRRHSVHRQRSAQAESPNQQS